MLHEYFLGKQRYKNGNLFSMINVIETLMQNGDKSVVNCNQIIIDIAMQKKNDRVELFENIQNALFI